MKIIPFCNSHSPTSFFEDDAKYTILFVTSNQAPHFTEWLRKNKIVVLDTIYSQLDDVISLLHLPAYESTHNISNLEQLRNKNPEQLIAYGNWVYYPWSNRIVHILPPDLFNEVQTNRNRDKITREEQALLATKKIGVIGLSVGRACALTATQEHLCGEIRLADLDTLDLSNLNRLQTGLYNLGIKKTTITYRDISEFNPYMDITTFDTGFTKDTMDDFLIRNGKLDLIIEECDDLYAKFLVRERARELGIPVIMETNDRGILDIERYDLEPTLPLFHGAVPDLSSSDIQDLNPQERFEVLLKIVGDLNSLSPRMQQSLPNWVSLLKAIHKSHRRCSSEVALQHLLRGISF